MKNRGKPTPRNALFGCMAGGWSLTALTALLLLTVFQRRTNYAWGMEGGFYTSVPPVKNQRMSPPLREIFYSTGAYYPYFAVFQQFVWITILLSSAGMALYFVTNRENAEVTCVIALALLGLVMFQTIFEARARYFFSYSPLFICAAFLGWTGFIRFLRSKVMRAGKKRG